MNAMADLITSGSIASVILALMLVEGVALTALHFTKGLGPPPLLVWSNLLAGAAFVLALRSALTGAPWQIIAVWLAASLVAHVIDLFVRWRR